MDGVVSAGEGVLRPRGGGSVRVSGPASICVWVVEMAQIQGTVPVDGQQHLMRCGQTKHGQSIVVARPPRGIPARAQAGALSPGWRTPLGTFCRVVGSPSAPGGAASGASMVSVPLMSNCGPGYVVVAATT